MTLAEVKTLLEGIAGFSNKVVYNAWPEGEAPALPFLVFLETRENPMPADGITYYASKDIAIELYTDKKDPTTEALVETALTTAGIFYTKSEEYLNDERCFFTLYEIEV